MSDYSNQPIDQSFLQMEDTLAEARKRQMMAEEARKCSVFGATQFISSQLEDALYPERRAQRIQEEMQRRREQARSEAKSLSDRELLEEIYVALKMTRLTI